MRQKILGVIGGLGPEAGVKFCLNINKKIKFKTKKQPHFILDNLPITQESEKKLINGRPSKEHLDLLLSSVKRLNKLNVDLIVIPCNTVHIFIDELRKNSKIPILSIIDETVKKCIELKKVGILGSTKTINSKLYQNKLFKKNIDVIVPLEKDQKFVSEFIIKIINNKVNKEDKKKMNIVLKKIESKGAQKIILGCTELPLILNKKEFNMKLISSMKILEESVIKFLINKNKKVLNIK